MSRAEERRWVEVMLERLAAQDRRRGGRAGRGDAELAERAAELSRRYLGGADGPIPASVRWVGNQESRWGSCTPADGTIRLSDRLRTMPSWVIDYVLVHELAHLIEPGHGPRFQRLVERYPKVERARGYLLGVSAAGAGGAPYPADGDLDADDGIGAEQAGADPARVAAPDRDAGVARQGVVAGQSVAGARGAVAGQGAAGERDGLW